MTSPRIAVVGAGLIGSLHAAHVRSQAELAAIIDPDPSAQEKANALGAPWHADLFTYLKQDRPDGVILATPNQAHVKQGLLAVDAGIPALIEKPISDRSDHAARLVSAAHARGVPLLVGHHRRHSARTAVAKAAIDAGRLGKLVAVNAQFWFYKPDDYFSADWRRQEGAGPVFINLIHDIDLLRHFCGEILRVQAMESRRTRGFAVEDTAVLLLEFANGALGTVNVSDTAVAPWSWEMTSGENTAYPHVQTHAYTITGTQGALSIPDLQLWHHPTHRSWWEPIESQNLNVQDHDPLIRQMSHFLDVIQGADPIVSGQEGLQSLRVIEAIKQAAQTRSQQVVDQS